MLQRRIAVLLAVPALALAACGGSDEDDIKGIINDVSESPSKLCDHATKKILDQVGGSVDKCKEAAKEAEDADNEKPKDVKVDVNGEKATATFKSGDDDNKVGFVKQDGDWKIDSVE